MNFKKNLISNIIFQIISIFIAFITSVIVARGLGPELQGQASYFLLIITTICEFGHLGINNSTIYYLKKSNYDDKLILSTNLIYLMVNATIIFSVLILLRISGIIINEYSIVVCFIGFISIFFAYLRGLAVSLYTAKETLFKLNRYSLIFKFIKIILLILIYLFNIFSINNYLIIMSIYTILEGLTLFLLIKDGYKFNDKFSFKFFRIESKYAIKMILAYFFIYLNYKMDQLLIKNYIGNYELGLYSVAVYLAELLFLIPTCINSALVAKISNMQTDFKNIIVKTIKITFNLSIVVSVIGCMCTFLVPYIYGEEYSSIKSTIIILFIGIIFASIGKVAYTYFTMNDRPEVHMYISMLTLVINFIGNIILIPEIGINGAAIASTISYTFYGLTYVVILKFKENILIKDMLLLCYKDIKDIKKNLKR